MSYVQAVLWIASRLADGLAYAHEHQVIHRDLKPANVLLADDGQPLLLDFNLSDNLRLRSSVLGASVGGTLPYMAPEQLESFYHPGRRVDARSDLYSLGLILYELVCGKPAFPFPQTPSPPTRALKKLRIKNQETGVRRQESGTSSQRAAVRYPQNGSCLTPDARPLASDSSLLPPAAGEGQTGPLWEILPLMIAERKKSPPSVRQWNKSVSPAVESIIRRCLEADPDRRYQSARELQEDLERQLSHQPLRYAPDPSPRERTRKWARRHPRLTSSTSVALLALGLIGILVTLLVIRGKRLDGFHAQETLKRFEADLDDARFLLYGRAHDPETLDQGIGRCRTALDYYHVLNNPSWKQFSEVRNLQERDREQLRQDIGETLFLAARATLHRSEIRNPKSETSSDPAHPRQEDLLLALDLSRSANHCYEEDKIPRALWQQQAELLKRQGLTREAEVLFQKAEKTPLQTAQDCYLAAHLLAAQGNYRKALPLLEEAVQKDPRNYSAWFVRGNCYDSLLEHAQAIASYSVCIALHPEFPSVWFSRGMANQRAGNFVGAVADFDQTIMLRRAAGSDREIADIYWNRAQSQEGLKHYSEAIADLDKALELGTPRTQVYFYRAVVREKAKDLEGARRDRDMGMRLKPSDEQSWVARGLSRMDQDPKGAVADLDEALKLNPQSFPALQNKAHVLADLLKDNSEAVQVLDTILAKYPENPMARAGRGVSLARLGQREKALADAEDALLVDTRPPNLYQVACIYALTSRQNPQDRLRAFELLSWGLKGGFGLDLVDGDNDLDPIRQFPEFRRVVKAARELQARTSDSR
jgi:serine/threonine protein kinase/Flp pilus assembly protein TadD